MFIIKKPYLKYVYKEILPVLVVLTYISDLIINDLYIWLVACMG